LLPVQAGQGTPDLPESGPGLLSATSGLDVLWRDIQRATLPVLTVRYIQMRSVQVVGIATADTVGIPTTAGGLRQSALDHLLGGLEESFDKLLLPTHHLILRYDGLVFASREKRHEPSKMFWHVNSYGIAETWNSAN
jgi:hypothetical protein